MNGDLSQVLTLLHTSRRRWRTLRAEGEAWQDERRVHEVLARLRHPGSVVTMRGAPGPADRDPRWRLWIRQPDHVRVEFGGAHQTRFVEVFDGARQWMSLPHGREVVQERRDDGGLQRGPAAPLVETAALPASLDLEATGRGRILGRETFAVRGRPRPGDPRPGPGPFHPLLWAADEVRLEVDAERGVILRLEAVLEGDVFHTLEMTEVAFDEPLPDELFVIPPAPPDPHADAPGPPPGARSVSASRRRAPSPPHPGPPEDVLGAAAAVDVVLARAESVLLAVDRVVAYPTGFELHLTVRTRDEFVPGTVEPGHPRTWGGNTAFPGESLRFGVSFSDGRRAYAGNFRELPPAQGLTLVPVSGSGTSGRFDQRFWVCPLPPPGPLGLVVEWSLRGIPETRTDIRADAILEAASRATPLWGSDR